MSKLNWDVLDDIGHGVKSVEMRNNNGAPKDQRVAGIGRNSTMKPPNKRQSGSGAGPRAKSKMAISAVSICIFLTFRSILYLYDDQRLMDNYLDALVRTVNLCSSWQQLFDCQELLCYHYM